MSTVLRNPTALLEWEIQSTDRETDRLVYELYDLTKDEIKIVEGE